MFNLSWSGHSYDQPLPSNTSHCLGARDRILDHLKDSKIPRVTYDTAPLMGPMMHQYKNVPALRLLIEPRCCNNTASFEFFSPFIDAG